MCTAVIRACLLLLYDSLPFLLVLKMRPPVSYLREVKKIDRFTLHTCKDHVLDILVLPERGNANSPKQVNNKFINKIQKCIYIYIQATPPPFLLQYNPGRLCRGSVRPSTIAGEPLLERYPLLLCSSIHAFTVIGVQSDAPAGELSLKDIAPFCM